MIRFNGSLMFHQSLKLPQHRISCKHQFWCRPLITAHRRQSYADFLEFKASLVNKASSRKALAVTERNSVSKNQRLGAKQLIWALQNGWQTQLSAQSPRILRLRYQGKKTNGLWWHLFFLLFHPWFSSIVRNWGCENRNNPYVCCALYKLESPHLWPCVGWGAFFFFLYKLPPSLSCRLSLSETWYVSEERSGSIRVLVVEWLYNIFIHMGGLAALWVTLKLSVKISAYRHIFVHGFLAAYEGVVLSTRYNSSQECMCIASSNACLYYWNSQFSFLVWSLGLGRMLCSHFGVG